MTQDPAPNPPGPAAGPARRLDAVAVQKALPHRYPFLLVDRVDILEEDKRCVGIKCVTFNEPFFQGHFPGYPVMPGVLIVEAMAQTACAMLLSRGGFEGKLVFFAGIEEAKFRAPVRPGDVLTMAIEVLRLGAKFGKFRGETSVGGKLAAEAVMSFAVADKQ